mgnify:CR=1 FL=1
MKKIAVLEGDGIGPEVMQEALKILDIISNKTNIKFHYDKGLVGAAAIDSDGNPFPESTKKLCSNSDAILFGAIGDPKYDNDPKAKVRPEDGLLEMRKFLGLYANVRPVITYDSLLDSSPLKKEIVSGTNFVVYRELTGGIYFGEKSISDDRRSAYDTCFYNIDEIERISHLAFKEATKRKKQYKIDRERSTVLARRVKNTLLWTGYKEVRLDERISGMEEELERLKGKKKEELRVRDWCENQRAAFLMPLVSKDLWNVFKESGENAGERVFERPSNTTVRMVQVLKGIHWYGSGGFDFNRDKVSPM